jgi:hypothetical protein
VIGCWGEEAHSPNTTSASLRWTVGGGRVGGWLKGYCSSSFRVVAQVHEKAREIVIVFSICCQEG